MLDPRKAACADPASLPAGPADSAVFNKGLPPSPRLAPCKTRRRQPGEYAPFSGRFQAVLSPAIASQASSSVMALHEALPDGSVRSNAALSARDAGLHPAFAGSPTIARTCFMVMNMRAGVLANG
jgi:hypothetical protein